MQGVVLKGLVGVLAVTSATLLALLVTEINPFLRRCNPEVCHSYSLSAFKVHRVMHQGAGHCDFGALPGFLSFNVIKPPGERWQTAVPACQLRNLLLPSAQMGHVRVLLLGDSVDAHLAQEWCAALEQPLRFTPTGVRGSVAAAAAAVGAGSGGALADPEECCKDRDALYYCSPAGGARPPGGGAGSVSVAMYHLPGVHLHGPFHTGTKGNFLVRVPAALRQVNGTLGGPPHLVLVHSNFWDQSRMWEQRHPGYGAINKLMPDTVFGFSSNFSLLLSTTSELLPEGTLLAARTAAFPAFSANWLGRWQYIHQLNMAAMEVTRLHGLPVVDLGGMVFGLEPRQYLRDQHHPNKIVLLEVANIAMNLLAQNRQQQQQQQQQGAGSEAAGGAGDAAGGSVDEAASASSTGSETADGKTGDASSSAWGGGQEGAAAGSTTAGAGGGRNGADAAASPGASGAREGQQEASVAAASAQQPAVKAGGVSKAGEGLAQQQPPQPQQPQQQQSQQPRWSAGSTVAADGAAAGGPKREQQQEQEQPPGKQQQQQQPG